MLFSDVTLNVHILHPIFIYIHILPRVSKKLCPLYAHKEYRRKKAYQNV